MQLPPRIAPATLIRQFADERRPVTSRLLKSWRAAGLIPQLLSRGRGRGKGKNQFWRSPGLGAQVAAVQELLDRSFPNDEARIRIWWRGFPVDPEKLRVAYISRLEKTSARYQNIIDKLERGQGKKFHDLEDKISAVAERIARGWSKRPRVSPATLVSTTAELMGIVFEPGYFADISFLGDLPSSLQLGFTFKDDELGSISESLFSKLIRCLKSYMSFEAVHQTIATASDMEFRHAHRRWRMILRMAPRFIPEITSDPKKAIALAEGFGRLCVPTIIKLIQRGRLTEIDNLLIALKKLPSEESVLSIMEKALIRKKVSIEDQQIMLDLIPIASQLSQLFLCQTDPLGFNPPSSFAKFGYAEQRPKHPSAT